ncbi:MAG: TetR/AcrR family transcriptional regulator [Clostridiales bacterium]|nr:TetR/AcrR family transcriptional regulator [Clostridiales bacterium]
MTKAESKYFNTAEKMDAAFLSLIEKKDFEYITVTEICKKAGVNRSTFYLHYENMGDLLSECVENMNRKFFEYFNKSLSDIKLEISLLPADRLFLITPEYIIPYLTYISEHRSVFKVVLAKPEIMQTEKTYSALFSEIFNPILKRYNIPEKDRIYMMDFYIEGLMGIIKRWLKSDCSEPVEDIARIMINIVRR